MFSFGRNKEIGVEIDQGIIRAVELHGNRTGEITLARNGSVALHQEAVSQGVVRDLDEVEIALSKLWEENDFSHQEIVLGVCTQGLFMRVIDFPIVPEDKLSEALHLQAGEHFPFPMEELILDYEVLGESEDEDGNPAWRILIVAIRREHLMPSMEALKGADLNVRVVDAASLAVMRLTDTASNEAVVFCNIGVSLNSVLVASQGQPAFARASRVALHSLVHQNDMSLQHTLNELSSKDMPEFDSASMQTWMQNLSSEVNSSLAYFSSNNDGDIERLMLSGIGARLQGVAEHLRGAAGVTVDIIDPLEQLTQEKTHRLGPDFAVPVGLALRGLEEG